RHLLLAARPDRRRVCRRSAARWIQGIRRGFRRRALDGHDGGRAGGAGDGALGCALFAFPFARGGELRRPRAFRHAQGLRRPRRARERQRVMDVAATARSATERPDPQTPPRPADPCAFVIFGASGDLTKRLLVPALYNLAAARLLPDEFAVIGIARGELS